MSPRDLYDGSRDFLRDELDALDRGCIVVALVLFGAMVGSLLAGCS